MHPYLQQPIMHVSFPCSSLLCIKSAQKWTLILFCNMNNVQYIVTLCSESLLKSKGICERKNETVCYWMCLFQLTAVSRREKSLKQVLKTTSNSKFAYSVLNQLRYTHVHANTHTKKCLCNFIIFCNISCSFTLLKIQLLCFHSTFKAHNLFK